MPRSSSSSRPSRPWCCGSARVRTVANETGKNAPGLHFKMAAHRERGDVEKRVLDLDLPVQTHPLGRPAEPRGRRLRALPDHRSAAVLSRPSATIPLANQRLTSFINSSMRNVLASASRDAIVRTERGGSDEPHPGGREPAGAEPRHRDHRRAPDPRRSAGREQPGGLSAHADRACSARRRICAPTASSRRRPSGPGPSATRPSSSPRPTARPSSCAARATPTRTASSPRLSGRIRTSSPSTARCRPMRPA